MTQYFQPQTDYTMFGNALADYISRAAGSDGLYQIALQEFAVGGWGNDSFQKLVRSTVEFYEYLVAAKQYDPNYAFDRAIMNCAKAGLAGSIFRQGLVDQLHPQAIPAYNEAVGVMRAIDEDITAWHAQMNQALAQPAGQMGRSHLYATASRTPVVTPALRPQHAPTTAPLHRQVPTPAANTPGVTGGWGYNRDAIRGPAVQPVATTGQRADEARQRVYGTKAPAAVQPMVTKTNAIPPAQVEPVSLTLPTARSAKEIAKMKYETHRLTALSAPTATARNVRKLDEFMGPLLTDSRVRLVDMTEEDTELPTIVTPDDVFAAFGIDMAILKARGLVGDKLNDEQVLEFDFYNVRPIHHTSPSLIAVAEINVPHILQLREAETFDDAFKIMNDYVKNRPVQDSAYSIADRIINEMNNRLTEAVNRLLAFTLAVPERIDDFSVDYADLLKLLYKDYDDFEHLLKDHAAVIIQRCTKVGAVDVDSPDFSDLNDFTRGELGLTISSIEQMSITMLPMMSCEMDLAIGSDFTYIVPAHFPKLYSVLDVLESRLEWGHYNYDRIYVVFEDGVKLEVVYTEIPVDDKKPELKDYYKVAVRKVMR